MVGVACPRSCRSLKAEGAPADLPVSHGCAGCCCSEQRTACQGDLESLQRQLPGECCFLLTGKCCLSLFQECLKKKEELKRLRIRKAKIVDRRKRGKRCLRETQLKLNACIKVVDDVVAEEAKVVADEKRLEEIVRSLGGDPTPSRSRR